MSDSDPVIVINRVSKAYRIWENPAGRLIVPVLDGLAERMPTASRPASFLHEQARAYYHDFQALNNISFQVGRGEAVGIVGRNGSGKSTLLQIIAGTLQPTTGSVRTHGRVAALLELGSGFNPEFSGRENVYLNGAVLGLSRKDVDERFKAIADFAEIGEFIEQPVKTYSSGMVVRLAFAVAAHVDAEVIIIDEALGVGDARFQLKCARAIDSFLAAGVTLLFVSHDVSSVRRLCSRAILLEQGQIAFSGQPNDVINLYSKLMADGGSLAAIQGEIATLRAQAEESPTAAHCPAASVMTEKLGRPETAAVTGEKAGSEIEALRLRIKALEILVREQEGGASLRNKAELMIRDERGHTKVTGQEFSYGGELGRIVDIQVLDADGQQRTWFVSGEPVTIRILVEAHETFPEPIFALVVKNQAGVEVYATNTLFSRQPQGPMPAGARLEVDFCFPLNLITGTYFLSLGFTHFFGNEITVIHRRYDSVKLDVHGVDQTYGIANLWAKIQSRNVSAPLIPQ